MLTLVKYHSGLSNLHMWRDKVDDVINGDLLSRGNAGVSVSFMLNLSCNGMAKGITGSITEGQAKWKVKGC